MTKIFVDTPYGTVSDHHEFAIVPGIGEVIFIQTPGQEIKLKVNLVEHYPVPKGDVMQSLAPITLQCEVLPH
jgi:hypothetical protein